MVDYTNEYWIDIIGYEGLYQISNNSRFKSLDRMLNVGCGIYRLKKGFILSKTTSKGYWKVSLIKDGIRKTFQSHILVAMHFIDNINNLPIVEHKDDNKSNDSIENLMWSTNKDNVINSHYRDKSRILTKTGIKAVIQYDLNGNYVFRYDSVINAQRALKSEKGTSIAACLTNPKRNKSAYGFIWRYEDNIYQPGKPLVLIEKPRLAFF